MKVPLRKNPSRAAHDRRSVELGHATLASRGVIVVVAVALSAVILTAAVVPGWIDAVGRSIPSEAVAPPTAKDLTTVYELPPIAVVASRRAELAKLEREERGVAIQQAARSKPLAKPPV